MTYTKPNERAERSDLRQKMRSAGQGYREIATELARRYNFRPRTAWREAYGWSLREAAYHINTHTGETGLDPTAICGMTGAHLCEYEQWPGYGPEPTGRRPTPYLLSLLASIYGCNVTELIDLTDRQHLKPAHLLVLDRATTIHQPQPSPHPALATDHTGPPTLTLVLPTGLEASETADRLAGVIAHARTQFAQQAQHYDQQHQTTPAAGDRFHHAVFRGAALAYQHAAATIDEAIINEFGLLGPRHLPHDRHPPP